MVQAYEMIKEFGEEQIRVKRLAALVSQLILDRMFEEDDLLLHLAGRVFSDGHGDSVILDYLCEHYNGSGESMFRILAEAVKTHVETYDLESACWPSAFSPAVRSIWTRYLTFTRREKRPVM